MQCRLDDGGETDLDLGNYERMMYLSLGRYLAGHLVWMLVRFYLLKHVLHEVEARQKSIWMLSLVYCEG